ncbi:hypothetical protein [Runella sp.]|uniref:hypothetical protein n=1 Tax=Runella sp. TaxID=1960881 RepID=UPI003D0970E6
MTTTVKTEFYADLVVNKIEKLIKLIYKIIWWIWPTVFWLCFFSLWFLPKNLLKIVQDIGERLLSSIPVSEKWLYLLALLPFWLWIVAGMLVEGLKAVRKYILYPKAEFTETAMVPVEKKERIENRQSRRSGSYFYFLSIKHPITNDLIHVEIAAAETFNKANEGDRVKIKHLLTPTNIIYLTIDN